MTNYEQFRNKLQEIFMMDHAELDFGIYRIMNQKRDEINNFLDNVLLPQVKKILCGSNTDAAKALQQELDKAVKQCEDLEIDPNTSKKVIELREKIAASTAGNEELENVVFNHLTIFFSRYYDNGDFVSKRRYKDNAYAIPYNGEEVKLHWANSDQYYIKTSEYFQNYTFNVTVDEKTNAKKKVHFVLKDVTTEQNNNKAASGMERRFALYQDEEAASIEVIQNEEGEDELNIYFTYELMSKGTKQDDLMATAFSFIKENLPEGFTALITTFCPTEKDKKRTLLQKHLKDYTDKNQFDYFIHKDLGGFLRRELDFYIKNEVLLIDDLDEKHVMQQLNQVRAIKGVGEKIITMLAQIEDFQKRLWLKKKFVVQSDYCITLDRVPESFYAEICENEAQRKEWVRLFAIDEIKGEASSAVDLFSNSAVGYSEPLTEDFLRQNPYLVLDTAFFSASFKHRLLSKMEDVDKNCNGLLINSDNFHALNLLECKYNNSIDAIYIDPPYNTGSDGFIYKDGYSHSSWLSMFVDRVQLSKKLQTSESPFFVSINSKEFANLVTSTTPIDTWFSIKVRHEERLLRKDIKYQDVIEYLIQLNENFIPSRIESNKDETAEYIYSVNLKGDPDEVLNIGGYTIEKYTKSKVTINKSTEPSQTLLKRYTIRGSLITQSGSASEFYEVNLRKRREVDGAGCLYKIIGMGTKGDGLGYRYVMQPESNGGDNGLYFQGWPLNYIDKGLPHPNYFDFVSEFNNCSNQGGVRFPNGKKPVEFLTKIIEIANVKKNAIVLDYFAGGGSTGHAVIDFNRNHNSEQKYILVEIGEYFNEKTRKRIQNVIYSTSWENGKPVSRKGISQCFKYIRLEQYEDTLNNLEVKKKGDIFDNDEDFHESYMLQYMMDMETRDSLFNIKKFVHPFDVMLKTTRDNELVETNVDMVDTFNYLIGLEIDTIRWTHNNEICVVEGRLHRSQDKALIIWRDTEKVDNMELNSFFRKNDYRVKDAEFDVIYVNGDNTLQNQKRDDEHWKVVLIEEEFQKRMFEEC